MVWILLWFFTNAADENYFMFLVTSKQVSNSVKVSDFHQGIKGEIQKIKKNWTPELCEEESSFRFMKSSPNQDYVIFSQHLSLAK